MNADAILFDLDGTLWDSSCEVCMAWNQIISKYPGVRAPLTTYDIKSIMGLQMDVIARKLFPGMPSAQQAALLDACVKQENDYLTQYGAKLFDHMIETLTELRKHYDLCIVSNCQAGYIEAFLKSQKVAYLFHDHICFGETGVRKGKSMQILMQRNGYQKAVYVGDTQGDCDEAEFAGIPFIYAAYGFGTVRSYQLKIEQPDELLRIFERTGQ